LDRDDVDLTGGLLVVRGAKFGKSRLVVCHPSTTRALRAYSHRRDQLCPASGTPSFFVWPHGRRVNPQTTRLTFRKLCDQAGLRPRSPGQRPPRLHDYADLRVMPTSERTSLWCMGFRSVRSA
jgi:Site-specific recombinase XerD